MDNYKEIRKDVDELHSDVEGVKVKVTAIEEGTCSYKEKLLLRCW